MGVPVPAHPIGLVVDSLIGAKNFVSSPIDSTKEAVENVQETGAHRALMRVQGRDYEVGLQDGFSQGAIVTTSLTGGAGATLGKSILSGAMTRARGGNVTVGVDAEGQFQSLSLEEQFSPEGNYSLLSDTANTFRSPDGALRADTHHPQPTGSFVREPGNVPPSDGYKVLSLESADSLNQPQLARGDEASWREGGVVQAGVLQPGEKVEMIVNQGQLKLMEYAADEGTPLPKLGGWASEDPLPRTIQPARDATAVKMRWKDESKDDLFKVELQVREGSTGVRTNRGEAGAVFDEALERWLRGGVIQHELNREDASQNFELIKSEKLESEE